MVLLLISQGLLCILGVAAAVDLITMVTLVMAVLAGVAGEAKIMVEVDQPH